MIALEIDGDARAYPLEILIWHELVNDTVGGVPVSVAYCPLCNSVTVYEREIDGQVLDFGVSGLLYNSSLVMYDRQTETLWSHFTGEPLYGALAETELVSLPATIVGFGTWRDEHPDGTGAEPEHGSVAELRRESVSRIRRRRCPTRSCSRVTSTAVSPR